jgi:asparagine synthase (glutamine-hydrolysing)
VCGICGISGNFNRPDDVIQQMLKNIHHRGPDDQGVFIDKGLALGARRLSIIDLKNGHQPMSNEDNSIWIVFNGEIYNFLELRRELEKKGHVFKTYSDTEVILHLYEDYDLDCVNKLNGMFVFCIWDKRLSRLILARDRFGIKPLYYTITKNILVFASELKSILCFPGIKREIEPFALDNYLSLGYTPTVKTIFRNIYKLPPAHTLVFKDGHVDIKKYWELEFKENAEVKNEHEAADRLSYLLKKAIKRHLISDVPLGIYLSGGIDSSSIVALSGDFLRSKIKTFSIGFNETSFDESRYSAEVSRLFNTEHRHRVFGSDDVIRILPEVTRMLDEPFADPSILPTYILSKFSRDHVTVALSGDGGDEIFAGYPTYQAHAFMRYYEKVPYFIKRRIIEALVNNMPVSYDNFSLDFAAKSFITGSDIYNPIERHARWMGTFSKDDKKYLYNSDWVGKKIVSADNPRTHSFSRLNKKTNILNLVQKLDIDNYLEGDLLVKTDRASMMNSQEVRLPYLDHELVSFMLSTPPYLRLKRFRTKYILKRTMKRCLPSNILNRRKKGFGIPVAYWIKKELKDHILSVLTEDRIKRQGLFNHSYIKKILKEHLENKLDNSKKIWSLFMFELWYMRYIE